MTKIDGLYDFADLAPATETAPVVYPSEAMELDGKYLEDLIDGYQTLTVTGRELVGLDIQSVQMGQYDGETVQYTRLPARKIEVKYRLTADSVLAFRQAFYKLNSYLGGGQHQAIFRDDPTVYWTVTLQDADVPAGGSNTITSTFTLYVADGVAHSTSVRTFDFDDTGTATVTNDGYWPTKLDLRATFTSDANSIGFLTDDKVIQLGTEVAEDDDSTALVPSTKVMNDAMGTATKSLWTENLGRVRWRYDDGEHTSKIDGALAWATETVSPSGFGAFDSKATAGYWHGPTLTRQLTTPLENVEVTHRIQFKPTGTAKQLASCQGLLEINYSDADNNFVMGFEMKDNQNTANSVTYSFFIGDIRMVELSLPQSVIKANGGFFGSVKMKKVGNTFTFQLLRLDGTTKKQVWAGPVKSWTNNTVAMLQPSLINIFMAQWRDYRAMDMQITDTRITQINTEDDSLIPLTFYAGDELLVEGSTNRVYINGLRNDAYRVIGSSGAFVIEPGTTAVTAVSDGSFTAHVEEREQYV